MHPARPDALMHLREMDVWDLDAVMQNEVQSYSFPWSRGIFTDCLRAGHECWVVLHDDTVVGHGVLSVAAAEAHVLNVCVVKDARGSGLGRRLIEHLIERARERRADVVFLEVRLSNDVAARLYESVGFNEIGRRRNYYPDQNGSEDARVYALQLSM